MLDIPTRAQDIFCFAFYGATHAINRAYAPILKPLGLTYPQYITLTMLWEQDGQGVGELASQLRMESSTLTPLIKRLENGACRKTKRRTGRASGICSFEGQWESTASISGACHTLHARCHRPQPRDSGQSRPHAQQTHVQSAAGRLNLLQREVGR